MRNVFWLVLLLLIVVILQHSYESKMKKGQKIINDLQQQLEDESAKADQVDSLRQRLSQTEAELDRLEGPANGAKLSAPPNPAPSSTVSSTPAVPSTP